MLAIRRIADQRGAIGKRTSFRIAEKAVDMKEVERYLKRKKKVRGNADDAASTPPGITYWTPSPSPTPFPDQNIASASQANQHYFSFPRRSELLTVSRPLTSPQIYQIPESLFFNIRSYFLGSFEMGKWVTDQFTGYLSIPVDMDTGHEAVSFPKPTEFLACCSTAFHLKERNDFGGFRRALSKAFDLIKGLLMSEHPYTFKYLIMGMFSLTRLGHIEVQKLRKYIAEMAYIIAHDNPWYQIYGSLASIDPSITEQVLQECLRCSADFFQQGLGPYHSSTVDIKLENIHFRNIDLLEEERSLRELLAGCEQGGNKKTPLHSRIGNFLSTNLLHQGRYAEAESLAIEMFSITGCQIVDLEALRLIAECEYRQDKNDLAEEHLRMAIEILLGYWGEEVWGIEYVIRLEGWLREWGREEEADELRVEWNDLLGEDDIDEVMIEV